MRKFFFGLTFMLLLLAACSPQAEPTIPPEDPEEPATQVSDDFSAAQEAAVSALSANLGLAADEIQIVSTEAVEWPDACLGVTQEGVACAEVITPGYKIVLEANGKQVEYHTDETGSVVVPATVALTWTREGGIAGFCDQLTIYLSGEVQASNCKTAQMVQASLSDVLSPEEIATMNEWISTYGEVTVDASDPKGAADAMSVQLTMYGTGAEQTIAPAAQQVLLPFVQDLYQEVMSQ